MNEHFGVVAKRRIDAAPRRSALPLFPSADPPISAEIEIYSAETTERLPSPSLVFGRSHDGDEVARRSGTPVIFFESPPP